MRSRGEIKVNGSSLECLLSVLREFLLVGRRAKASMWDSASQEAFSSLGSSLGWFRLGLTLYFVIPRVPAIYFDTTLVHSKLVSNLPRHEELNWVGQFSIDALTSTDQAPTVSSSPATFSFYTNLSLTGASFSSSLFFTLALLISSTSLDNDSGSRLSIELYPYPSLQL